MVFTSVNIAMACGHLESYLNDLAYYEMYVIIN